MSANADSVRFKLASNNNVWVILIKYQFLAKLIFLQIMFDGLGKDISCITVFVVSDFEALFK